ncbi:exostosin family protein [Candidatus Omnitrophota bacterium]
MKDVLPKIKKYVHWRASFLRNMPDTKNTLAAPRDLQPLYHTFCGYYGPWIENYFYGFWCRNKRSLLEAREIVRIYVPIFWTDYYIRHDRFHPNEDLQAFIDNNISPDKKYFTVVQNADGIIENLPDNVLIFAAGGVGDVPIPLLKGELQLKKEVKRDIRVSFMGSMGHDIRKRMYDVLKNIEGYYFGKGTMNDFIDITSRSLFALCPRGYGRTSYKLYEALALGSIPVYIWDDIEWLPYRDRLDWDDFSISINIRDIEKLPAIIDGHTPDMIKNKQDKIKEIYNEYFTMEGVCGNIVRILKERS